MIWLSLAMILLAGIFNAAMDRVSTEGSYSQSIFPQENSTVFWKSRDYFDKHWSWVRKYKNLDPTQGPAFPGSTSIFVLITDFWHLAQAAMLACFTASIVTYQPIIGALWYYRFFDFIIYRICFGISFWLCYNHIFKRKS